MIFLYVFIMGCLVVAEVWIGGYVVVQLLSTDPDIELSMIGMFLFIILCFPFFVIYMFLRFAEWLYNLNLWGKIKRVVSY